MWFFLCRIVTPLVAFSSRETFARNHLSCLSYTGLLQAARCILGVVYDKSYFLLSVKIKVISLSYKYIWITYIFNLI